MNSEISYQNLYSSIDNYAPVHCFCAAFHDIGIYLNVSGTIMKNVKICNTIQKSRGH